MSDLTDAIEAAALAMYGTPRLADRNRDMAERAINAAEAIIRADERARVAEEAMAALERIYGPGADDTYFAIADELRAIARQHATVHPEDPSHRNSAHIPGEQQRDGTGNPPESHAEPRTGVATHNGVNTTPDTTQAA